jgi:hypothetical protein
VVDLPAFQARTDEKTEISFASLVEPAIGCQGFSATKHVKSLVFTEPSRFEFNKT